MDNDPDPQFGNDSFSSSEVSSAVVGLLTVGHISETYTWAGHRFEMETPCFEEELESDQIISRFQGTLAQGKAMYAAKVAACLRSVDGTPLYTPLEMDEAPKIRVQKQFEYMLSRYNFAVIQVLHEFWQDLERKQDLAILEFQGK